MCHQLLVIFTAECRGCVWTEASRARAERGPRPTPLMASPWARAASTHCTNLQYHNSHNTEVFNFTYPGQPAGSSEFGVSHVHVSTNLENDLYNKSSSPKTLLCHTPKTSKGEETLSLDGPLVFLQRAPLPNMRRSWLSYGALNHAYHTTIK